MPEINGPSIPLNYPEGSIDVRSLPSTRAFPQILPHLNPIYGADMNINAAFGGTPDVIYSDGAGMPSEWTPTAIVGTWDFLSTTQVHSGTYSIDGTNTADGDIAQFKDGGLLTGFQALSGWLYLATWQDGKNNHIYAYGYNTTIPDIVGNRVCICDYVDTGLLNTWQKFVVPFSDLGLTGETIDSMRIEIASDVGIGNAPNFYLDDMQLEQTGGAVQFIAEPAPFTWFYACRIKTTFILTSTEILTDLTVPLLDPTLIGNIPAIANGVVNINTIDGQTVETFNIKSNFDLSQIPLTRIADFYSNGTGKTLLSFEGKFDYPLILKSETGDNSKIIINDNLTALTRLRVILSGFTEVRVF